jgi:predicted metal-dependent peptidase
MKDELNDKKFSNFHQRWEWLIAFMTVEDLFVHEILMIMDKRRNDAVKTMGVRIEGTRIILEYCLPWTESLSDPELRYVITHEVYHLILHHCTIRLPFDLKDRKLYNQAADLAINSMIPTSSYRTMPKDKEGKVIGLLPETLGFDKMLSMEQYVQLIRDKQDEQKGDGSGEGDGQGGGDGDGQGGGDGDGHGGFDNHDGWKEEEVIKEIVRNKIMDLAKNERVWGKMPGDIKALIMAAQTTTVSWERYLKYYIGRMASPAKVRTMKRPDKRFGFPYCGTRRKYVDRKLVAIDTSGSIGDDELSQFLAEVNRLAEIHPVDLVLFDDGIQLGPISFHRKHATFDFKGRGGTDFSKVFELASERKYQSVIMLTDGCAGAPEYPQGVKDVLWVLTGSGNPPVEWGERVRITPKNSMAKAA